jgi:hypothetical protein
LNLKATDVGELAARFLDQAQEGRVSRLFQNSLYVRLGRDYFLILRGRLRSPTTINVISEGGFQGTSIVGDVCAVAKEGLTIGKLVVRTGEARTYSGGLRSDSHQAPIPSSHILKGTAALNLLYGASGQAIDIAGSMPFRLFASSVLWSVSKGDLGGVTNGKNFLPLVGAGGGFTPAGDDFVGGFAALFNHVAALKKWDTIRLPRHELEARTVPESAALLDAAQEGFVDEEVERLILSALGRRPDNFFQHLLGVARRGHTSGIDVSLGILMAAGVVREIEAGDGTVRKNLETLGMKELGTL